MIVIMIITMMITMIIIINIVEMIINCRDLHTRGREGGRERESEGGEGLLET